MLIDDTETTKVSENELNSTFEKIITQDEECNQVNITRTDNISESIEFSYSDKNDSIQEIIENKENKSIIVKNNKEDIKTPEKQDINSKEYKENVKFEEDIKFDDGCFEMEFADDNTMVEEVSDANTVFNQHSIHKETMFAPLKKSRKRKLLLDQVFEFKKRPKRKVKKEASPLPKEKKPRRKVESDDVLLGETLIGKTSLHSLYSNKNEQQIVSITKKQESFVFLLKENAVIKGDSHSFTLFVFKGSVEVELDSNIIKLTKNSCIAIENGQKYRIKGVNQSGSGVFVVYNII